MIGVGAVFEWAAKTKYKAPEWLAELGFEWIVRLIQEPKIIETLLVDNFLFIIYFIKQYFKLNVSTIKLIIKLEKELTKYNILESIDLKISTIQNYDFQINNL